MLEKYHNLDLRYIYGRDNYACVYCGKEVGSVYFSHPASINLSDPNPRFEGYLNRIDESLDWDTSNVVVTCDFYGCKTPVLNNLPKAAFPGRLIVIASCMFSEKTTTTRSLINKYSKTIGKYIWIKPDLDSRGSGITTHNKEDIDAETISSRRPDKHLAKLLEYQIIAFDEVQFYSERILYVIHQLLYNGKLVIVNGLKLDFKRNIFGMIHYLLAEADDIISSKSICNICNKIDVATRTKRKSEKGPTVEIGGADTYYTVCADCDSKGGLCV